jgi:hypothetical protein
MDRQPRPDICRPYHETGFELGEPHFAKQASKKIPIFPPRLSTKTLFIHFSEPLSAGPRKKLKTQEAQNEEARLRRNMNKSLNHFLFPKQLPNSTPT